MKINWLFKLLGLLLFVRTSVTDTLVRNEIDKTIEEISSEVDKLILSQHKEVK